MSLHLILLLLTLFHDQYRARGIHWLLLNIFSVILFSNNIWIITEIPKLLPFPQQSLLSEGSLFRLLCSATAGDKPLFFQWTKNGIMLSNSPQTHYKIETSDDLSLFSIKSVERSDSGNYSCIVRNAFGEDFKFSQLSVKGLIYFQFNRMSFNQKLNV